MINVNGAQLEEVPEFKYLGCTLNESGTDNAECRRKMASWRKGAGDMRPLANVRGLQLECARLLHEGLLMTVLLCKSETMIWRKKGEARDKGCAVGQPYWVTT